VNIDRMQASAGQVSELLKLLGHRDRLMVLCQLKFGEASVGELARRLHIKQSPLSQHLARMRREGVVVARREGQTIYYALADGKVAEVVTVLYNLYCSDDD
jgi:DNA-binding transcriptional ArsR family regulator